MAPLLSKWFLPSQTWVSLLPGLYLHSSLVQTRKIGKDPKNLWEAIKFNVIDSAIALNLAFFVNAAILVLAAATFYNSGLYHVEEIQDAHKLLAPMLGTKWASILFAVALIAAGQSSTITGTLAGQIVMEGYLRLRIQPWLRRLLTRLIAILPALLVIGIYGEEKTGQMLIFSQVVLSLQLGFAIIPLIHFVSDEVKMGEFAIKPVIQILSWVIALIIVSLNVKLVVDEITGWIVNAGDNEYILWLTVVPISLAAFALLLYITFAPFIQKSTQQKQKTPHGKIEPLELAKTSTYKRIAIAIDFSNMDSKAINSALAQGGKSAEYILIHIVESAGALLMGREVDDMESGIDKENLKKYAEQLEIEGYQVITKLGYGSPKSRIPKIAIENDADLLVMGTHGHKWFKDLLFGTTVDGVRHRLDIPIFIVRDKD